MVHVGGWDWALVDRGDGVSVLQSPTPSHRATRLNHLIIIYYNVAMAAVELTGAGRDSDAARTVYATLLVCRAATPETRAHVPYNIVLIDTAEGFRMMAHGDNDLAIGDRVTARFCQFAGRLVPYFEKVKA